MLQYDKMRRGGVSASIVKVETIACLLCEHDPFDMQVGNIAAMPCKTSAFIYDGTALLCKDVDPFAGTAFQAL